MGIGHDGTFAWFSMAALVQMAFCGMILIGFAVWMFTNILPVMQNAPDASFWINPIMYTISQPIGGVVAIVGACLLLKRRNIGLYVSIAIATIAILLAICWKVERHRLNDDARKFVVSARVLLADIFSRCKQ